MPSTSIEWRCTRSRPRGSRSPRARTDAGDASFLTDDDTRRLAAQHRDQARRDGVDILRAYDARPGDHLKDAGPRAHREAHRAPGASPRGAHDADVSGVESRAGQGRRDHDVDTLGEAQPDLPRGSLE